MAAAPSPVQPASLPPHIPEDNESASSLRSRVVSTHFLLEHHYAQLLHIPPVTPLVHSLHTTLRSSLTPPALFSSTLHTLTTLLLPSALRHIDFPTCNVTTPTGAPFPGLSLPPILVVTVLRAGDAFLPAVRSLLPSASIGQLLIQRDESSSTKAASLLYAKLPRQPIAQFAKVLLLDPMLASGNSLVLAIEALVARGVKLHSLVVVVVIASEEGIARVLTRFPHISLVVQWVDDGLNDDKYIVPGLGDAGDRYFAT